MDTLVEKYIALRDAKDKIKAAYVGKAAKIDVVLDKIEAQLLDLFQANGIDSIKTSAGTAYKQKRTSATVGDWDSTLRFIVDNEFWHMLERRISKDAVVEYKREHGDLPPGVNWREELVINVRRS